MEFLRKIDNAAKVQRIIVFTLIIFCFGFSSYTIYSTQKLLEDSRNKVYVLSNGGNSLELALARNTDENVEAEIKNHVRMFHEFFFNLDPDPEDIKKSIEKALYLIDDSGKQYHYQREESLFYHKIVDASISLRIDIDSIVILKEYNPYGVKIYGTQRLIRPSKILYKSFVAQCQTRTEDVKRTDHNPHGIIIEKYRVTENKIIGETQR